MDGDGQRDPDDPRGSSRRPPSARRSSSVGDWAGSGSARWVPLPSNRVAAIRVAGFFINWLTGAAVSDTQSGFRVCPARLDRRRAPAPRRLRPRVRDAGRRGRPRWRLVEVPVAAIHFAEQRSRFRPKSAMAQRRHLPGGEDREALVQRAWLIVRALCRPFTRAAAAAASRSGEFTASHRHHPRRWRRPWRVPRWTVRSRHGGLAARSAVRRMRVAAVGHGCHARAAGPGPRHASAAAPGLDPIPPSSAGSTPRSAWPAPRPTPSA